MSDKPLHPGFEIAEQFFQALRYPPLKAAQRMGIAAEELEEFLSGRIDLDRQGAEALQEVLSGWRTADWILKQQEASRGVGREPV